VRVDVVVAADTLLGLDDAPAVVRTPAGDAPISAELARRLAYRQAAAADPTWRRILTDPATGIATDLSPAYRPPARLAEFVRVRDGHISRHPTSGARTLELDHVTPFDQAHPERGGRTTAANLAGLGKRDHQTKTDRLISVNGNANHTLTIRTPAGHAYPAPAHQYADPRPTPEPGPTPSELVHDDADPPY